MNQNVRRKVVFIGYPWKDHELDVERKIFDSIGAETVWLDHTNPRAVSEGMGDADVIIYDASYPITREFLETAPRCQAIIRNGVGVDSVDLAAATAKGIIVGNVVGHCTDEVADHALALLLCCARFVIQNHHQVSSGIWDWKKCYCHRLRGSILGIVGFGKIGQALAQKVKPLGIKVLVYDIRMPQEVLSAFDVTSCTLEELCSKSDYISIHAPLTHETEHLIGEKELRLMKRDAYLINAARGTIIDEKALIKALSERWIAGAGLDVLELEPPDTSNPLLSMDNVIVTSHFAFYSEEAIQELRRKVCEAGVKVLTNGWPDSVVNPEVKRDPRNQTRR